MIANAFISYTKIPQTEFSVTRPHNDTMGTYSIITTHNTPLFYKGNNGNMIEVSTVNKVPTVDLAVLDLIQRHGLFVKG
jgi:hypothetical protein